MMGDDYDSFMESSAWEEEVEAARVAAERTNEILQPPGTSTIWSNGNLYYLFHENFLNVPMVGLEDLKLEYEELPSDPES